MAEDPATQAAGGPLDHEDEDIIVLSQGHLFEPSAAPVVQALRLRDRAMASVSQKAEDVKPRFGHLAAAFILRYLHAHGPTSGEVLTLKCKAVGIVPHDDRAFGPVYFSLAKGHLIRKVGTVKRLRGHGTAGGNVWEAV